MLYVIYDGECYFCNHTAKFLKIRKNVGQLILIDARQPHELVTEAVKQGIDINEGVIVYYHERFYHGKIAINLLNDLADQSTFSGKLSYWVYRNKLAASIGYPILKLLRKLNLWLQRKPKIHHPEFWPTFKPVFGEDWERLPTVIKKHYANRPYSSDITRVKGLMTITFSPLMKFIAPFLSFFNMFAPKPGKDIPVEVDYLSSPENSSFIFDRRFYYQHLSKPFKFKTVLWQIKENMIIDVLRFGLGLKMIYQFDGTKIRFIHCGYALVLGKLHIPLPLTFILGKGYGEETPINDTSFHFFLESVHPLFGRIIRYEGVFTLQP